MALFRVDFTGRGELADRQVSSAIIVNLNWRGYECQICDVHLHKSLRIYDGIEIFSGLTQ